MPLKKSVAMERRIDLASLLCLVSRHGPAVLLALLLIGCSVAGFFVLRNLRDNRRRRRRRSHREEEVEESPGDTAATGPGDEEEEEQEEHLYRSHIRQRRASTDRPPYRDKVPDRDRAEVRATFSFFWHRSPPEDLGYSHERRRSFSRTSDEDAIEEVPGAVEPGQTPAVGYEEQEKVIEADSSEDITSTTEGFSDEEIAQEEETSQLTFESQSCPAPVFGTNGDRHNAEDTNTQQEVELENGIAPVSNQDEFSVSADQKHHLREEHLLDHTQQADILCKGDTVSEVMNDLVVATHDGTQKQSEPLKLADTKDDRSLTATIDASFLSSIDKQQAELLTSDTEINQSGLCPQVLSCFETDKDLDHKDIGLAHTKSPETIIDEGRAANSEAVGDSVNVSVAGGEVFDQEERINRVETVSDEVIEENHVEASVVETCECKPVQLVDTQSDRDMAATTDVTVVANLSSNGKQQSESVTPASDTGIDQNGLGAQELSQVKTDADKGFTQNDIGLANTDRPEKAFDGAANVEVVSGSLEVNIVESKDDHQEADKEAETSILSINTTTVQIPQSKGVLSHVQDDSKADTDNLSNQKDSILEQQQTLPISEEKIVPLSDQEQSLQVEECLVHPSSAHEVMENGTGLSSLPSCVKEVSTATQTTVQTNDCLPEGIPDLDTEITLPDTLPAQISEGESNQDCDKDEGMSTCNISASTRGKIESMVEQMVAQVYKDVTQNALEAKVMQLEENQSFELSKNDGTSSDNLAGKEVARIVVSENQAQSVEMSVNSIPCPSKITSEETDTQKDSVLVASDASENKYPNASSNYISPQEDDVVEVKSMLLEQNVTLEHLGEVLVQPLLVIDNGVSDHLAEPVVNVIKEETSVKNVCSTLVPDIDKDIQAENENESISKSYQFEQQSEKSVVLLDIDNDVLSKTMEKEEGDQEIKSSIDTEILEMTETPNKVQSEPKETEMLLGTGNNVSGLTAKSGKVVIVCRTMEACVSTTEMFDDEVEWDSETSRLEMKSKIDSCQGHSDVNGCHVIEEPCANLVAHSDDTLAAQTLIEEMTAEQKQSTESGKLFDLTSHAGLDIPQDRGASMESTERTELRDNRASTPSLESGISSMTISPDEEESRKVTGQDDTLATCQIYAVENNSESGCTSPVVKENSDIAQCSLQISINEDLGDELSMTNEDSFGSEIEDDYHKATEELMTQFMDTVNATESVELGKTKDPARASQENGEKVDSERTEINIMEATMDHNEWITDSNYPALPWMTASSLSKDPVSCAEARDLPESKPQASSSDESAKKVLAVQPMPQNVDVTFRVHYVTLSAHQTVAVTGDQAELGAWRSAVPLAKTKDGYWACVVSLPPESHVEWKFVVLEKGEVCRWEECGNRQLYTGYGDDLLVHKWWGFL